MNIKAISRNVGFALLVSAAFMLASVAVSILEGGDEALSALLISFLITLNFGIFPFIFVRRTEAITLKDGYLIIVLSWLFSFIFGMLPYVLWGGPFTLENAWFESVSGFTTTGATILEDVESLPRSLLFWRSSTHFIGGLGVVVFLLLVIPNSNPVRLRLTNMELSSLSKSDYAVRANHIIYVFTGVYLTLFILSTIGYMLVGMGLFDAVCHAMSVTASGGFSTRNMSILSFDSRAVEGITMVFMFLSSVHFGLLYILFVKRSLKPLRNSVLKFYVLALLVVALATAVSLKVNGICEDFGQAAWLSAFQTISVASTTGFAITDNSTWPMSTNVILLVMAVMCGCAGSTSGGVKADRVLILLKSIKRHVYKSLHPASVKEVKFGLRVLKDDDLMPHVIYIAMYVLFVGVSILLALIFGVNNHSAFAASVSSFGNVGPAIAELGYMGNFNDVGSAAKVLFSIDMFLGRVEIYPVLAIITMAFDRRGH